MICCSIMTVHATAQPDYQQACPQDASHRQLTWTAEAARTDGWDAYLQCAEAFAETFVHMESTGGQERGALRCTGNQKSRGVCMAHLVLALK